MSEREILRIPHALADEMIEHCRRLRPQEGCGILGSSDGEVVKVFRMSNMLASPVRYALDPKEQFAVHRVLEDEGWDLGAVFHSHTRTGAYPSPTDVRLALEEVPYVIVSFASEPPEVRAFRILKENWTDPRGRIVEVPITIDR